MNFTESRLTWGLSRNKATWQCSVMTARTLPALETPMKNPNPFLTGVLLAAHSWLPLAAAH